MIGLSAATRSQEQVPLAKDDALWVQAQARARTNLELAARGIGDIAPPALAVAAAAVRERSSESAQLLALARRALARTQLGSETALRCLRALARAGESVDLDRLNDALTLTGRAPRIALVALAEVAAREQGEAHQRLVDALTGTLRIEAALVLSHIGSEASLDALSKHLRTPGPTGIHAASALLSIEDDPFAFEVLCERLCENSDAVLAAKALWNASPNGSRLLMAEATLARWARRGVKAAESGRIVAAVVLAAGRVGQDIGATLRALSSEDDELVLLGAQAAYGLGDAERARGALLGLFRRGPTIAAQAFQLLSRWADLGDGRSYVLLRGLLDRRPVDLGRSAIYEALAATSRPALCQVVVRGIGSNDRLVALEACRALGRLREPPSIVPPLWI